MRTFKKTICWSVIAFMVTAIVGWMLTGDLIKGGWIALLCRAIKVPAYYYHERWWTAQPVKPVGVERVEHFAQEDYETESRRTLAMQAPGYVRHCNAG